MYRHLILAATLLLTICAETPAASPPKQPVKRPPVTKQTSHAPVADTIPLLKQGLAAMNSKQLPQAAQFFKQAIARMSPADPNLVVAVDGLAHIYYQEDRYQEALPFAKKAIPLMAKRYGSNSVHEADSIYLLANIQHQLKDVVNAEAGYKRSLLIYELPQNMSQYSRSYASTLENLGNITGQNKQFEKALSYHQKALSLRKQHQEECGTLLENIGIFYQNQNQPEEATRYYEQALASYQQNPKRYQNEINRVSFKLANIQGKSVQQAVGVEQYDGQYYEAAKKAYNVNHDYPEAARQFKLALDQATRFYPSEEKFIMMLESALGKSLYYSEDLDAALPYLEKAVAYQTKHLKANDPDLLNTVATLGFAYNKKGDYTQAQKHLQHVKEFSSPDSALYTSSLTTLADNMCHQGQFLDAKTLYEEALKIHNQKGPDSAQQVKSIQYQLALLDKMFKSQQGIDELLSYSKEGLRRWKTENSPITILLNPGAALPQWNERYLALAQKAFQEWQTALPKQARFSFTDNPEKADVILNWTDRPLEQTDVDAKVGIHKLTTIRSYFLSSEIVISLSEDGKTRTDREIYATVLHEVGHMLGLQHSNNLSDVMAAVGNYAIPAQGWPALSANDIQAARILYQQPPAITNPQGITLAEYQKFNEATQVGIEALRNHNYKQANHIFEQVRTIYSQDPYINYFSGLSAFQAGDYKEAREIFENLPMPQSTKGFSVDSQLGLVYVELGHKYNKWGRKNKVTSNQFYEKGVFHLQKALQSPEVPVNQKLYLAEKLREGENRSRPEPVYVWEIGMPTYRGF